MFPKILKITFVILILITVGEIGYYFYILNKTSSQTVSQNNSQSVSFQVQISPIEPLIKSDIIDYLKSRPKNENQTFYLLGEEKGFLSNIKKKDAENNIEFAIVDNTKKPIVRYSMNKDKLKSELYQMINGKKVSADLYLFQEGAQITHTLKVNLVNSQQESTDDEFIIK